MLRVDTIRNGIVIDHIRPGYGLRIFNWLALSKADFQVALVVNASSERMGRKDIIKIDNEISLDFMALGLIDPDITVNVVENHQVTEKIALSLPERVEGILRCANPRCISMTETHTPQVFLLSDPEKGIYRCEYCDEMRTREDFR